MPPPLSKSALETTQGKKLMAPYLKVALAQYPGQTDPVSIIARAKRAPMAIRLRPIPMAR
jgi:hypothetical protein